MLAQWSAAGRVRNVPSERRYWLHDGGGTAGARGLNDAGTIPGLHDAKVMDAMEGRLTVTHLDPVFFPTGGLYFGGRPKWAAGDFSRKELARSGGDILRRPVESRTRRRGRVPGHGRRNGRQGEGQEVVSRLRRRVGVYALRHRVQRRVPRQQDSVRRDVARSRAPLVGHQSSVSLTSLGPGSREAPATRGWPGARSVWMASDISRHGLGSSESSATPTPGAAIWARLFGQPRQPLRAWLTGLGGPWAASTVVSSVQPGRTRV